LRKQISYAVRCSVKCPDQKPKTANYSCPQPGITPYIYSGRRGMRNGPGVYELYRSVPADITNKTIIFCSIRYHEKGRLRYKHVMKVRSRNCRCHSESRLPNPDQWHCTEIPGGTCRRRQERAIVFESVIWMRHKEHFWSVQMPFIKIPGKADGLWKKLP
jgi:hypothetical protein